jgi:hypothetical protein
MAKKSPILTGAAARATLPKAPIGAGGANRPLGTKPGPGMVAGVAKKRVMQRTPR